jgi:hypothetical protein
VLPGIQQTVSYSVFYAKQFFRKSISFKSLKDEHFNSPHGTGDGVLGKEVVTVSFNEDDNLF